MQTKRLLAIITISFILFMPVAFATEDYQNTFAKVKSTGQPELRADNIFDILNINGAGSITITTTPATDTVTITGTGGTGNATVLNDLGDVANTNRTKGNLLVANGTLWQSIKVGVNGLFLKADSSNPFGVVWSTISGTGNATVLNDLGDVIISSPAYGHILQWSVSQSAFINKLFNIPEITCPAGQFINSLQNDTISTCATPSGSGNMTVLKDAGDVAQELNQTKGNLFAANGTHYRGLKVGSNDQVLVADSTKQFGLTWKDLLGSSGNITKAITATGQLFNLGVNALITNGADQTIIKNLWFGSDAGDSGRLRLSNQDSITWEASPAGNDGFINFTSAEEMQFQVAPNERYEMNSTHFEMGTNTFAGSMGCTNNQEKRYNSATGAWDCFTASSGGGSGIPKPTQASPKKWGQVQPVSATADLKGLLQGSTLDGTETYTYNTARNSGAISSACGTVAGGNCGVVLTATNRDVHRRDQNSYLYADVSMSAITGQRIFIGFRAGTTPLPNNADTIVNALNAFGVCIRTTDTLYQRCENDGAGTGTYTSLGVTEDTAFHTFEIYAEASNNQWCVKVDGGSASCATTDIPAATTRMWINIEGETSDTTSENFIYTNIYVENDR